MTTVLDPGTFAGSVYSGGWIAAHGGIAPIVEPATGAELGTTGVADAQDVADACAAAAAAQRDWAAENFAVRAAVLRR
ncbi:MAG TPA: aldehyde dehydrogenase family protein, partial [Actinophytocola sp.]|nr:aldehyde dehydrogenase family protein [Actinophytocola sp.]